MADTSIYKSCHYCDEISDSRDHVVPRSLGGSNRLENKVPACRSCNSKKGTRLPLCNCESCVNALKVWISLNGEDFIDRTVDEILLRTEARERVLVKELESNTARKRAALRVLDLMYSEGEGQ